MRPPQAKHTIHIHSEPPHQHRAARRWCAHMATCTGCVRLAAERILPRQQCTSTLPPSPTSSRAAASNAPTRRASVPRTACPGLRHRGLVALVLVGGTHGALVVGNSSKLCAPGCAPARTRTVSAHRPRPAAPSPAARLRRRRPRRAWPRRSTLRRRARLPACAPCSSTTSTESADVAPSADAAATAASPRPRRRRRASRRRVGARTVMRLYHT